MSAEPALCAGTSKPTYGFFELPPGEPSSVEFEAYIGPRTMIDLEPWGLDTGDYNIRVKSVDDYPGPGLAIQQVELTGPLIEEFPTRGHQLLFDGFDRRALPPKNKWQKVVHFELQSAEPQRDAANALLRIARQAFRRPVTPADVADYMDLFNQQLEGGASLEDALLTAVAALLCSPDFLYLHEPRGPLSDYALATRLSYFLTRTTPDAALTQAADQAQLAGQSQVLLTHARVVDRSAASTLYRRFL